MGTIHELIEREGRDTARLLHEPAAVDAAFDMMTLERDRMGFLYSGFALASLPHNQLPPDAYGNEVTWEKHGHGMKLIVQPGRFTDANGMTTIKGVPFGPLARLILIYLQSEALRTGQREIVLGRSMYEWLNRMRMSRGGKTYKSIREQARRISVCSVHFARFDGRSSWNGEARFVEQGLYLDEHPDPTQPKLWEDTVTLDQRFFAELTKHAVPLSEEALSHLTNKSLAIDIYIWLAYRLHALERPTDVTWKALQDQFGTGYKRLRDFRRYFEPSLKMALAVYPDARVEDIDGGIRLFPSRPPIAKRQVLIGG